LVAAILLLWVFRRSDVGCLLAAGIVGLLLALSGVPV